MSPLVRWDHCLVIQNREKQKRKDKCTTGHLTGFGFSVNVLVLTFLVWFQLNILSRFKKKKRKFVEYTIQNWLEFLEVSINLGTAEYQPPDRRTVQSTAELAASMSRYLCIRYTPSFRRLKERNDNSINFGPTKDDCFQKRSKFRRRKCFGFSIYDFQ